MFEIYGFDCVHQRESSEETERHLKQNTRRYNGDCAFLLNLLRQGHRLNARQVEKEYNMDGRRLRELKAEFKEVQKQWVYEKEIATKCGVFYEQYPKPFKGYKTKFVEYFI